MTDFFTKEVSRGYDERNQGLAPIAANMHFLIGLILKELPARSRILCVGVGTGAEILHLAAAYPEWTFVGVDPSASMLEVCQERLAKAGIMERCELVHGYVKDVTEREFDAAVAVLVGHFVSKEDRPGFYQNMLDRTRSGGYLVDTELSFDLGSEAFPLMLQNWEQVSTLMGATPESLAALPKNLKEVLTVLPPAEVEDLLRRSGIGTPVRFFQSFLIHGWYGRKG